MENIDWAYHKKQEPILAMPVFVLPLPFQIYFCPNEEALVTIVVPSLILHTNVELCFRFREALINIQPAPQFEPDKQK